MTIDQVKFESSVEKPIEKKIRTNLFKGFNNWNGGYEGWLEWCNTLYEKDAHYNIPGPKGQVRLTLQQYKDAMGELFKHFTMELGQFENMIIKDDWCAIRYTVIIKNLDTGEEVKQNTMEFVHFKEYPDNARVIEGWALSDVPLTKW